MFTSYNQMTTARTSFRKYYTQGTYIFWEPEKDLWILAGKIYMFHLKKVQVGVIF